MNTRTTTDAQLRTITQAYIDALTGGEHVRQTYLRLLITDAVRELGATPLQRAATGRRPRLSADAQAAQLAALDAVQGRHAPIIDDVVEHSLEDVPAKARAGEKNRRTNFARTALYVARRYIKAGHDLTALPVPKMTKTAMSVASPTRAPSAKRLKGRVERASKGFMAALLELSESDRPAAVSELNTLIGQLAAHLAELGVRSVADPARAAAEGLPLKLENTVFLPTETYIERQSRRPS